MQKKPAADAVSAAGFLYQLFGLLDATNPHG